jgi:hypothetical protein
MIRRTMEFQNEQELIAAEQAVAMARELKKLADAAPDGQVLAVVEMAALEQGRRFMRQRLQDALNAQCAALEKKGGAADPAPAARRGGATARRLGGSSPPPAR